jgi:acetyl-CoA acetyltransferase
VDGGTGVSWALQDQVAIVGIGQTSFWRHGRSERTHVSLALEAVLHACADAGVDVPDIDGFATYSAERSDPYTMAQALGVRETHFMDRYPGGGESLAGIVHHAAMAIASGVCEYVVCYRSLSGRLINVTAADDVVRPAEAISNEAFRADFLSPFGALVPAHYYAMQARRHMIDFGTTSRQFGAVAVNQNRNAQRNPNAIHYGRPITIEDHQASRMIADPYHLYDCTQEADGACAIVVTSRDRARALPQAPVLLLGAAEGSGPPDHLCNQLRHLARFNTAGFEEVARDLFARAGMTPSELDVAQIFETFTGQVVLALEDFGFCARGDGGPFVESGAIGWPDGELPINTAGGGLAEGYLHGFNNLLEAVRQLRGTSTSQVDGAETCLVTSGPSAMPSSAMILRRS